MKKISEEQQKQLLDILDIVLASAPHPQSKFRHNDIPTTYRVWDIEALRKGISNAEDTE